MTTDDQGAGNAAGNAASSRSEAPSLRCGPAGDPAPPAANRLKMAESKLPAISGPAG